MADTVPAGIAELVDAGLHLARTYRILLGQVHTLGRSAGVEVAGLTARLDQLDAAIIDLHAHRSTFTLADRGQPPL